MHGKCFIYPPGGYGSGSTVLKLNHIEIHDNPPIKSDALVQL